jgi:hypothetical protein
MDYKIPEKTRATQGPRGSPRESPRLVHNAQLCCLQKRPGKESELRPNCVFADVAGKSRNQVSASSSLAAVTCVYSDITRINGLD